MGIGRGMRALWRVPLALALSLSLSSCGCSAKDESTEDVQEAQTIQPVEETTAVSSAEMAPEPAPQERLDALVLVNKTHALPEGWEERLELVSVDNSKGETVEVDRMAYEAFLGLQQEMADAGIQVELNSGYRSVATQQQIVDEFTEEYGADYVAQFVAEPGHSEHHTGIAFDVFITIGGVPQLTNEEIFAAQDTWDVIHAAAPRYGFIVRYPEGAEDITGYTYEPWHLRYVGIGPATEIYERGITLEEYLGELY